MLTNYPKTRLGIYLLAIAAQVASFFVTIYSPEFAQAFSQTSDVLGALALGTAASNLSEKRTELPSAQFRGSGHDG